MRKKILLIKVWAIGEVILSTPCIEHLKAKFPESELYFLVGNNAKDIVIANPNIEKVFCVDENIFLKPDIIKLMLLIGHLRKEKFNIIIVLHYSLLFSLFAFLIGAPKRVGFKRPKLWSFNTANIVSTGGRIPRIFEYLRALDSLSISPKGDNVNLTVYPKDEDRRRVALLMEENKLATKKFIILSPTGGENPAASRFNLNIRNKVWPIEYYKKLANLILKNTNFKLVIVGGRIEKERAVYIKNGDTERIIDITGKINLRELTLLAEEACISISNDSGPLFILSSSSTPIIAIFGPTNPELACSPLRNIIVMKEKLDCSPCYDGNAFPNRIRNCKDAICMKSITPEKVFQKIYEILKFDEIRIPANL